MELQRETRQNIVRTTGLSISELLNKKPDEDVRLKRLQRKREWGREDLLVRGNPQLTLGSVTPIEKVDEYFDKKQRNTGDKNGSRGGISK